MKSPAAQNRALGQDTDCSGVDPGSMEFAVDHDVPFQENALPVASTAVQKFVAGHDTALNPVEGSMESSFDHELPFQVSACPKSSTAAQNVALAQDEWSVPAFGSISSGFDHEPAE